MKVVSIAAVLGGEFPMGTSLTVRGWVRTRRDSKAGLSFIHLHDGSAFAPLQVVADQSLPNYTGEILELTAGCALVATGTLVASQGKGQTVELHLRYLAPVPLNQPLRIVARVTRDIRRIFEGTAELKLPDGTVAVEAAGKYFNLIGDTLPTEELETQEWRVYPAEDDPRELEI